MNRRSSTAKGALPRIVPVITPDPENSASLLCALQTQKHGMSIVPYGSRTMYRMLREGHSPFAVLDLPLIHDTGQATGYVRRLRRISPVLLLAEDEIDAAQCFEEGANDVLRRNAHPAELVCRLGARWRSHNTARPFRGDGEPHPRLVRLSASEQLLFDILRGRDSVVSRLELRSRVAAQRSPVTDRALTQLVYRLNHKLQPLGLHASCHARVGYRLTHPGDR